MFELMDTYNQTNAVIKVIGVGGGGGNAVEHMVEKSIEGVEFICANTDSQALKNSRVKTALQIGCNITKGLGAGANPDIGRQAAMEDRDRIYEVIEGADMLFITAGMGGGTGTGATPVVAQVAKELGILTVAVVTRPFGMEGNKRMMIADQGIAELGKYVDSLITIPNEKLLTVLGGETTLLDAFRAANQVLQGAVQGIAELITRPGLINVDFADVRTVMSNMGRSLMGTGCAKGEGRARLAAEHAITSPLLDNISVEGATGVLINVVGGPEMKMKEIQEAATLIQEQAHEDANIIFGLVHDPRLDDEVRITVIATGVGDQMSERPAGRSEGVSTTAHSHPHSHPVRETAAAQPRAAQQQQAALRLPLIDDRIEDAPLHRPHHDAAPERNASPEDWAIPAEAPETEQGESINIPAYIRRWRGKRRGAPA